MNRFDSTIAAIATPPGNSGVGIVRISGPGAPEISDKMFCAGGETGAGALTPRVATLGTVFGSGFRDTALAIYFRGPNSFTGEDVVEFQSHGGWFLLNRILQTAIGHGAVMAAPGEFSKRAFLNGKMSLDAAEAVIDIINAESELQLRNAGAVMGGALHEKLQHIERALIEINARAEAAIDYPDETDTSADMAQLQTLIQKTSLDVGELIDTAATGRIIANGVRVAMLGKPNVGKSSLFNALLGTGRSIVTNIAGTTTDTIEESIIYRGVKFIFVDTAGVRDAQTKTRGHNQIEKLGIERTRAAIESCDVVLCILDASKDLDKDDEKILQLCKNKPHVVAFNKSDLTENPDTQSHLNISALKNTNIEKLKSELFNRAVTVPLDAGGVVITNQRHLGELRGAAEALARALAALERSETLDCVVADVRLALMHIGNITGTNASEAVLDEIFSRFCLGK